MPNCPPVWIADRIRWVLPSWMRFFTADVAMRISMADHAAVHRTGHSIRWGSKYLRAAIAHEGGWIVCKFTLTHCDVIFLDFHRTGEYFELLQSWNSPRGFMQRLNRTYSRVEKPNLLDHKDVRTTMVYLHVLNKGGRGVRSPADMLRL